MKQYKRVIKKYKRQELLVISDFIQSEKNMIKLIRKFLNNEEISLSFRTEDYKEFVGPFFEGNKYLISKKEKNILLINRVDLDKNNELTSLKIEKEDFETLISDYKFFNLINEKLDNYIFPMGTVVKLKEEAQLNEHLYMITDRFVLPNQNVKEYYQYKGLIYPLGNLSLSKGFFFNNEDIEEIEFIGYETILDMNLVEEIGEKLKEEGIVKINHKE